MNVQETYEPCSGRTFRILAASMVEKANSGHPGGAMGGADFVNVLFSEFLVYDPENPAWEGRDRFFLDPGHMSPMLYSTLALAGKFTLDDAERIPPMGQPHSGTTPNATLCAASKTLPVRWDKDIPLPLEQPSPPSS